MDRKDLLAMPKVELHCHLDGSLPLATMRRLARQGGVDLPDSDSLLKELVTAPPDCGSLLEYLTRFDLPLRCLQTAEALQLAAESLLDEAARENLIYLEVRFAPLLHLETGLMPEAVVEAVLAGLTAARSRCGVEWGVLLCAMRHHTVEQNLSLVTLADRYRDAGVVGLDLVGDEAGYPPGLSGAVFHRAHDLALPFTIHAGECGDTESVRQALDLHPRRIGHGIALQQDPALLERCVREGVGVEICPCSNLQTKAAVSWETYPFPQFYRSGLLLSVNTDNRTVTGTSITAEFSALHREYAVGPADVRQLTLNALETAFTTEDVKEVLRQRVLQGWDTIDESNNFWQIAQNG